MQSSVRCWNGRKREIFIGCRVRAEWGGADSYMGGRCARRRVLACLLTVGWAVAS
jgi:hypothetical protein